MIDFSKELYKKGKYHLMLSADGLREIGLPFVLTIHMPRQNRARVITSISLRFLIWQLSLYKVQEKDND